MSALVVDVLFRDRVLETVPFDRPTLRVGRMPENDLVIDNLGVSRFHARLQLEERRVFLEDAGSENGCLVNGERVAGRREIAPGDRISIGKHELRVRSASAADEPGRIPARRKSDAFDGARTFWSACPPVRRAHRSASEPPPPPVASAVQGKEVIPMSEKRSALESVPFGVVALPSPGSSPELDFDFDGALDRRDRPLDRDDRSRADRRPRHRQATRLPCTPASSCSTRTSSSASSRGRATGSWPVARRSATWCSASTRCRDVTPASSASTIASKSATSAP